MSKSFGKKITILVTVSLLVALLLTASLGYLTTGQEIIPKNAETFGLCTGISSQHEAIVRQKIGTPLTTTKEHTQVLLDCIGGLTFPYSKANLLKSYVKSWQFYANWLILTLPFAGLGYVFLSRSRRLQAKTINSEKV